MIDVLSDTDYFTDVKGGEDSGDFFLYENDSANLETDYVTELYPAEMLQADVADNF
jgi:hypothetical protein